MELRYSAVAALEELLNRRDRIAIAALYLAGVGVFALQALARPGVADWDDAYYRTVAEHILAGEGAVTGALWTLLWEPQALPFVADIHWMPLPSRILIPGLALWPAHGDQLTAVLLAGLLGPLAWATARALGLDRGLSVLAGAMAATGLAWSGALATADSVVSFAVIGGGAVLAAAHRKTWVAAGLLLLAGLTRTDGFLLAPALALAWVLGDRSGRAWLSAGVVAASGPLGAALWHARGWWLLGSDYLALRGASSQVLDHQALLSGVVPASTLGERLAWLGSEGVGAIIVYGLVFLPVPVFFTLWRHRVPWARAAAAYMVAMPLAALVLAPGIAASGSLFRSGAALLPVAAAGLAADLGAVGRFSHRLRGYHPLFVPVVMGACVVFTTLVLGPLLQQGEYRAVPADLCAPLASVSPDQPVLSRHPLLVEARCGHPGVVVVLGMDAQQVSELVQRYGIRHALAVPDDLAESDELAVDAEDIRELLPGWSGEGLLWTGPTPE